jgi:hypothetical protein
MFKVIEVNGAGTPTGRTWNDTTGERVNARIGRLRAKLAKGSSVTYRTAKI